MTTRSAASLGLVLLFSPVFASACTAGNVASQQDIHASEKVMKTSKPGASVQFSDVSGKVVTSSTSRTIRVNVADGYKAGILTVKVMPNPELSISGPMSYAFDMAGSEAHDISLKVKPLSSGTHYLNYIAIAEYGDGQVARASYAVPIYSGVTPQKTTATAPSAVEKLSGERGVITMDAEETISDIKP